MPEIDPIKELGRKLLRQGVPRRHAVRIVQELLEHRDDLEAEVLAFVLYYFYLRRAQLIKTV